MPSPPAGRGWLLYLMWTARCATLSSWRSRLPTPCSLWYVIGPPPPQEPRAPLILPRVSPPPLASTLPSPRSAAASSMYTPRRCSSTATIRAPADTDPSGPLRLLGNPERPWAHNCGRVSPNAKALHCQHTHPRTNTHQHAPTRTHTRCTRPARAVPPPHTLPIHNRLMPAVPPCPPHPWRPGCRYHAGCIYPTPSRLARHLGLSPDDPSFAAVGARHS